MSKTVIWVTFAPSQEVTVQLLTFVKGFIVVSFFMPASSKRAKGGCSHCNSHVFQAKAYWLKYSRQKTASRFNILYSLKLHVPFLSLPWMGLFFISLVSHPGGASYILCILPGLTRITNRTDRKPDNSELWKRGPAIPDIIHIICKRPFDTQIIPVQH